MQQFLAHTGVSDYLRAGDVDALAGQLLTFDVPARTTIFAQGQPGDRFFIIIEGKVKIVQRTPRGRESLLALLGPTDMFGELALLDPGPRTSTATTISRVKAVSMDHGALHFWIAQRPHVAEQLLGALARRLQRTDDHIVDMIFTDVPGRVAKQLLHLAARFGATDSAGLRVRHDLSQKELSQLVGSSRETVNKALVAFEQRGWIAMEPKGVIILDHRALARRSR
ncbi:Crp/Fnr family transcriptional regulator [Mycobacterium pinniadriaticum]|uniref:Crp/Fnr family transcriptional regulator n=1 Tax=Mycobacterium pinniadriaticum TaxID=2994102 RepID=UPI00389952BE